MDTRIYINEGAPAHKGRKAVRVSSVSREKQTDIYAPVQWILSAACLAAFSVAVEQVSHRQILGIYCAFFAAIVVLFHKEFSFRAFGKSLVSGWQFWALTGVSTALLFAITFLNTFLTNTVFPTVNAGTIGIICKERYGVYFMYAVTFVILEPLAENLALRKAMLKFKNKGAMAAAVFAGLLIVGLLHAHGVLGVVQAALLALPLTIVYLKSKNVYIPLIAQFVLACYTTMPDVVYSLARLTMR